ncbi:hypothetical protein Vafri_8071 [Volvox africanus]|uniref:Secreted protein n=1 Tax=Volvox africanus TaxID=51714 RepID=A0A8J4B1E2_9CHLO|nr:hypothetical protein Vafri_8071 [Volvox africanus]
MTAMQTGALWRVLHDVLVIVLAGCPSGPACQAALSRQWSQVSLELSSNDVDEFPREGSSYVSYGCSRMGFVKFPPIPAILDSIDSVVIPESPLGHPVPSRTKTHTNTHRCRTGPPPVSHVGCTRRPTSSIGPNSRSRSDFQSRSGSRSYSRHVQL